jgi:ABC-type nitrate/sulfonate/bicarbonate transport system substrate-binding protein
MENTDSQKPAGNESHDKHDDIAAVDGKKVLGRAPNTSSVARFFGAARERFELERWGFVFILVVLLLVGFRVYFRGKQANEGLLGRPLRVGIVSWPGYAGGLVANNGLRPSKDSDFWNKHKLLVEFVLEEDEVVLRRKFVNSEVDVMWSTVDSLAQQAPELLKQGVHPRAFMQVDWSRGGDAIIASAEIKRIEDLKGKSVAVSMSASQWLFEYSLENSSLTDDERTAIRQARTPTKGSQEAREQFVNGNVAAAVLWEPDVTEALRRRSGSKILVDTRMATNLIADVMVAKEEFIEQHPDVIAAFIEGWLLDGTTRAISDPMQAVRVLQDEPDFARLGEEKTHELLGKTAWATLDDNVEMFGLADGKPFFDPLFNWASRLWSKNHYIRDPIAAEQARDIGRLKEIYSAQRSQPKLACGAETPVETIPLAILFPPGKAEIKESVRSILDNQKSLFTLQSYRGARFCVQADPVEGDDPSHAVEISRARETAIIEYLAERYKRPRSQFVSASASSSEPSNIGTASQYIRLRLSTTAIAKE